MFAVGNSELKTPDIVSASRLYDIFKIGRIIATSGILGIMSFSKIWSNI